MCVFCYLNKIKQAELRDRAQFSTDRFEHTLTFYKKIYLNGFKESLESELCNNHKYLEQNLNYLKESNPIEIIEIIFELFINAYLAWINNDSKSATNTIEKYLTNENLFKTISLEHQLLFRARYSEQKLSHWDMFHIPFNKRYLIKNQRYSLVGRPMLYLAFSPTYVLKELNYQTNDKNYYISGFYLKEHANLKICDFRYLFPDSKDTSIDKLLYNENEDKDNFNNFIKQFKISIIASICSFKKRLRDSQNFCEEYVLPQILSEIVSSKKYDGLIYSSTKTEEDNNNDSFFDANVVIFTKYDKQKRDDVTYVYDKELYEKFVITTAKRIDDFTLYKEDLIKSTIKNIAEKIDKIKLNYFLNKQISNVISYNFDNDDITYTIHRSIVYEILVNNHYHQGGEKNESKTFSSTASSK